jgi:hypothetical protein
MTADLSDGARRGHHEGSIETRDTMKARDDRLGGTGGAVEVMALIRSLAATLPPTNAAEAALYARLFAAVEDLREAEPD